MLSDRGGCEAGGVATAGGWALRGRGPGHAGAPQARGATKEGGRAGEARAPRARGARAEGSLPGRHHQQAGPGVHPPPPLRQD